MADTAKAQSVPRSADVKERRRRRQMPGTANGGGVCEADGGGSFNPYCDTRRSRCRRRGFLARRSRLLASSKHKMHFYISCKQEIPPASWHLLFPTKQALRGPHCASALAALPSLPSAHLRQSLTPGRKTSRPQISHHPQGGSEPVSTSPKGIFRSTGRSR